jgi:radical SAM superfamily enzyme YgiQ (UPF0313 family)
MKKILLINPWIYDFAAYNFGIKPVGLLNIAEYLRRKGDSVCLIDCLDGYSGKKDEYGFSKFEKEEIEKPKILKHINRPFFRYGKPLSEFESQLKGLTGVERILVSSGMTYWYPGVHLAIEIIKKYFRNIPVLLGGIYATLCYNHAKVASGADIVHKGAYLNRKYFFENAFYPAYDLLKDRQILPLQLTRGCPFKCSYCASKIFNPEFEIKEPSLLFDEVMYYSENFNTSSFVFYDDALLFRREKGIKKFLKMIVDSKRSFNFHTPNGLHAKYIDIEVAELLKKTSFRDLRISFETSDKIFQKTTGSKVTNSDLKKALKNLQKAGFTKKDLGVYILAGAPWFDMKKSRDDILFINSLGAKATLASYSPIPGTDDYDKLIKQNIIEENLDPLWHNNTIFGERLTPSFVEKMREIRQFASRLNAD